MLCIPEGLSNLESTNCFSLECVLDGFDDRTREQHTRVNSLCQRQKEINVSKEGSLSKSFLFSDD
jgi:hypothetical protein